MARFDPDGTGLRPDYPRSALEAGFVGVMRLRLEGRGMQLIRPGTRCIRRHDIHELIMTEQAAAPGERVEDVAYLGFVEFQSGGVLAIGDEVRAAGRMIGRIAGFDETHMPNHLNILLTGHPARTGVEQGFVLGERIAFCAPASSTAAG